MNSMKLTDTARKVLEYRYLKNGETPEEMVERVATSISTNEVDDVEYSRMMRNLDFLPNTPTLINAGKPLGQLAACFVIPVLDSIDDIFDAIKITALVHKSGGGTGFSFSRLRPAGSAVKETGGIASGPVSFMRIFDAATNEMKQGGTRRGANMGILRVDHPDIFDFIRCKETEGDFDNFNISVAITNEFMECVLKKQDFTLRFGDKQYRTLPAVELWNEICDRAWDNGEPGVIFIDRINETNPLRNIETIEATNPCAEQPLPPYGSCVLGSINVSRFVMKNLEIDWERLRHITKTATRFLDDCIDVTTYPVPEIREEELFTRRIGLGIMGLADAFIRLKIKYGSDESFDTANRLMKFISKTAVKESERLGESRGIPEACVRAGLQRRNALVTTIAPTGSLSLIAGCSSGCEPVYAQEFEKECINDTLEVRNELYSNPEFSEYVVTAHSLSIRDHIDMQASLQPVVDSGISKTINAPNDVTREDVRDTFLYAWNSGLKSIAFYRDGSRKLQAQVNPSQRSKSKTVKKNSSVGYIQERPVWLSGQTVKIHTGRGKLYVTINESDGFPFEVFLKIGKSGREDFAYSEAIGRLISLALRSRAITVEQIIQHLKGISGAEQVFDFKQPVRSVPDAVAIVLKELYFKDKTINAPHEKTQLSCPDCGGVRLHAEGNCVTCIDCGYSKCS